MNGDARNAFHSGELHRNNPLKVRSVPSETGAGEKGITQRKGSAGNDQRKECRGPIGEGRHPIIKVGKVGWAEGESS